jgi:hypothetical protein
MKVSLYCDTVQEGEHFYTLRHDMTKATNSDYYFM